MLFVAAGCAQKEVPPLPAAAPDAAPAAAAEAPAVAATGAEAAPAATAAAATTAAAAPAADGAKVYQTYCTTCHGAKGQGDGPASAALKPKPADFATNSFKYDVNGNGTAGDIDDIKAIVHDGAAKHGGSPLMTPWPMLKPEQLQAVAEYVKSLGA
jgi:mono/diheme cytochrome c family protein